MEQHTDTAQELFEGIHRGETHAFDALFRSYYPRLLVFARTYLAQSGTAEEAVSDVFVQLWLNRGRLQGVSRPETYLYVSVKNRCMNALRSSRTNGAVVPLDEVSGPPYEAHSPERDLEHRELYEMLNRIIDDLPQQQRTVFRMIRENGLTSRQAAGILGLSPRTVETHLYKAVLQLEKEVTAYLGYAPGRKRLKTLLWLFA